MTTMFINTVNQIRALHDNIIVTEMNFQERFTSGGIVIPGDDGKSSGIRPRWARVYAIGPNQQDVHVGQYVCVAHGRWTRGVTIQDGEGEKTIRKVDPSDILLVSDDVPTDDTVSDKV